MTSPAPMPEQFRQEARAWLAGKLPSARSEDSELTWGEGEFDVSIFQSLDLQAEKALVDRVAQWQHTKLDAGFGALSWPVELGGRGLDARYEAIFAEEEETFAAPPGHELVMVTVRLVAPTLREFGTAVQKERQMRDFLRADQLCCQLFSEPAAGSDLASLATRAVRVDGRWVVSGQKTWSSGAHLADWGLLVARTDPEVVKHRGITAFLVRLDSPGIEIRPIRQMSGGSSFCEVFLDRVELDDDLVVGEVGEGWSIALATLGFEREASDGRAHLGGEWEQVRQLAEWTSTASDPLIRQRLARVFTSQTINRLSAAADAARRADNEDLGATGSLRKLQWVSQLRAVSDAVEAILGDRLVADTGEWGTFGWSGHVLGALGYSVAGGTDEIQRKIIAERLLGLPGEPRTDNKLPWNEVRR